MIPTIGRIVHYNAFADEHVKVSPAIITRVHNEECVNLRVFFDGRPSTPMTSVVRGDKLGQWNWPPKV